MQKQTKITFSGLLSYREFRETGPRSASPYSYLRVVSLNSMFPFRQISYSIPGVDFHGVAYQRR